MPLRIRAPNRRHSTSATDGPVFPKDIRRQTRKHQYFSKDPANSGEMKSVKFAGKRLAYGGEMLQDREHAVGGTAGDSQDGKDSEAQWLLPKSGASRATTATSERTCCAHSTWASRAR